MKTIAIDFDGVLPEWDVNAENNIGDMKEGSDAFLETIKRKGFEIEIYTARDTGPVKEWFIKHGLDHLVKNITNKKPQAYAYIDDKAITFTGDFSKAINDIATFIPYWKRKR